MIYFLKRPGTDRIAIRYYRTRRLFEKSIDVGEILLIKKGSRTTLDAFHERFGSCRTIGLEYYCIGNLKKYLTPPMRGKYLLASEIAKKYAITKRDVRRAMHKIRMRNIAPENARMVYEAVLSLLYPVV